MLNGLAFWRLKILFPVSWNFDVVNSRQKWNGRGLFLQNFDFCNRSFVRYNNFACYAHWYYPQK